jgi:hypothetical protein
MYTHLIIHETILTVGSPHAGEENNKTQETTSRKPMLLFLLSALFLLRFAERQLIALLFHEPPRITRYRPTPSLGSQLAR